MQDQVKIEFPDGSKRGGKVVGFQTDSVRTGSRDGYSTFVPGRSIVVVDMEAPSDLEHAIAEARETR